MQNLIEKRVGHFRLHAQFDCARNDRRSAFVRLAAVYEDFFVVLHNVDFFLAHGSAHNVRLTQGKACQSRGNLHNLLLVQNYAVGIL